MFGFGLLNFDESPLKIDSIQDNLVAKEREKHILSHALKCFTYGKPVKRDYQAPIKGK